MLALRQDILPESITDELKNLLDRLPVVPFDRYLELIETDVKRPIGEMYSWVDPIPTGSASIAQIHRATTREGDSVIIKVVKPGIRETLNRDAVLLRALGVFLQILIPRYRPKQMIREFVGVHPPRGRPAARRTTPRRSPPTSTICRESRSPRSTASTAAAACCAWSS